MYAEDYENERSEYVALENYSVTVSEESVAGNLSVGVGDVTEGYYFTDYPADDCLYATVDLEYTETDDDGSTYEGCQTKDIYKEYGDYYYLDVADSNKSYTSWEITKFSVGKSEVGETEFQLTISSANNFEMGIFEEPKVPAPTLELYSEDNQVVGVKVTNNISDGSSYVYVRMINENYDWHVWSEGMSAKESKIIRFEEMNMRNPEIGTYQLMARTYDSSVEFNCETIMDYPITIVEADYTGETIEIFWEYEQEGRSFSCYIPVRELPSKARAAAAYYSSNDGEWISNLIPYKSEDGSHWIFQDQYNKNWGLEITGLMYYYNTVADAQGATFTMVDVPEKSIQITERNVSKKNIAFLDYDHYMSFVASGGTITFDNENGIFSSATDGFKEQNSVWSLEGFVEYITGTTVYCLIEQIAAVVEKAANLYWFSEVGEFTATGLYDTEGNEISDDSIPEHEIVLVKYEPEIVWVDSMELTAPSKLEPNDTATVTVDLDAGQDKYPFNRTPQVRYASSNPEIVAVDAQTGALKAGTVTGTAVITAYADEELRASEGLDEIVTASIEITVAKKEIVEKDPVTEVFKDISEDKWYVDSVQYVYNTGIMSGNNGNFNPKGNVTRAQVISTLYRLAGSPKVTDYSACDELVDVQRNAWYTDAVCWAYNTGVGSGNASTKMFNVTSPVTRQQLASFFYKFAEHMELDTTQSADISGMKNANQVSSYAKTAVEWAVGTGIISGSKQTDASGNTVYDLNPKGTATRAQQATILQKFCENNDL